MPTHYQGTPQETLALNTFIRLSRAAESVNARLQQNGALDGLTTSQFGVLETLFHLGPMCQSQIGEKLLRSGGNITLVIDNLQKLGLVTRRREPQDRRKVTVSLTQAGEELIRRVFPVHLAAIVAEMGHLTPAEQEQLGKLCKKLGKGGTA